MGLTVRLENERGEPLEQVEDPANVLHRLLPDPKDASYLHLTTIDWYGDTVFNHFQAPRLLEEWRRMAASASTHAESALLKAVERLAEQVASGTHLYLKFYGD